MAVMTVRAAAARLGIGYSTLKQWIYDGRVRTTRTAGGHHRLSDAEIERLIAAQPRPVPPKSRTRGGALGAAPTTRSHTAIIMALSGRNRLRGFVEEVRIDGLLAQVRLRVGDQRLTAVITRDAVEELKLRRGDDAVAIIKATEVMIARETEAPARRARRRRPTR